MNEKVYNIVMKALEVLSVVCTVIQSVVEMTVKAPLRAGKRAYRRMRRSGSTPLPILPEDVDHTVVDMVDDPFPRLLRDDESALVM